MCNDLLKKVENALVKNATTTRFLFASTAGSPLVENAVMINGNLPNVRNAFCPRTDYLRRKVLSNVASADFTCILEICSEEKLVLFLNMSIEYKYLALV